MGKLKNHKYLKCNRGSIVSSDNHTLCIHCLGDDNFVDLQDRVCEDCKRFGDSTFRCRRYDLVARQASCFQTMLEKEDRGGGQGSGVSQAGSVSGSQSMGSLSQSRGHSVVSSGASSCSRAPSLSQSKVQVEVEVALSEGDDEFLEIFVTEP